jgi:hypothetical protein
VDLVKSKSAKVKVAKRYLLLVKVYQTGERQKSKCCP